MSGARRKAKTRKQGNHAATVFARGFVATGLLSALDGGTKPGNVVLRKALQGGAALAAGTVAAAALSRRDYPTAIGAVVVGAIGLFAIDAAFKALDPIVADKET